MLTVSGDCSNSDGYSFKSSPESCYSPDYNDLQSDEDFLQQLSSDLDIPLLLNPGEDELSLLNSFYDKSPDEIMSEIVLSPVKSEPCSSSESNNSNSPVQSPGYYELIDEVRFEPVQVVQKKTVKRVPIQPKTDGVYVMNSYGNPPPPKVVLLEPSNMILNGRVSNIDTKFLKRQQRKIKNRESACLSRKKKKDYLTSLETQVKDLTDENTLLKSENKHLKERLSKYENIPVRLPQNNQVKNTIVLCMFLFSVGFNMDYLRNPFGSKVVDEIQTNRPRLSEHHGRNLLWADEDVMNSSAFSPFTMCPAAVNQTESARLARELERWIGKPDPKANITKPQKTKSSRRRKPYRRYDSSLIPTPVYNLGEKLQVPGGNKEIQVFSTDKLYGDFFEAINRQDDTFYVVSFSDHHMLLPALHHNKTRRPKMSLIMPSMLPNGNITEHNLVPLMQIDCEVLNTRLIQVNSGLIPQHLRNQGNGTSDETSKTSKSSPEKYSQRKAYKPYFVKNEDSDLYNVH